MGGQPMGWVGLGWVVGPKWQKLLKFTFTELIEATNVVDIDA